MDFWGISNTNFLETQKVNFWLDYWVDFWLDCWVDFSIWLPYGDTTEEAANSATKRRAADDTVSTVKVRGPQDFEAWKLSFEIFGYAVIQLGYWEVWDKDDHKEFMEEKDKESAAVAR